MPGSPRKINSRRRSTRLCRENGTSIFQVEKACGIGNGVIGKWKQETQNPSVETLKKLAEHFGVTLDELVKESE